MKQSWRSGFAGIAVAVAVFVPFEVHAAQIQSIDFKIENGNSMLRIQSDTPLTYDQQDRTKDQQLLLNIKGASVGPMASRPLDTSSFDSPVSLVTAYPVNGDARVVVQLRQWASAQVRSEGNSLVVEFPSSSGETSDAPPSDASASKTANGPNAAAAAATESIKNQITPEKMKAKDHLSQFIDSRPTKNFTGKRITIQVREADVRDILRLIGDASGFNIVMSPEVQGKLSLSLVDVPWDQALDVVLQSLNLGAERNQNVLRVLTLASMASSKQQELAAKVASEASAPRVTKVFPISYADLESISKLIKTFGKNGPGESTATVDVDKRTNSIVVQDIADNIERMTKIIEILDTQTPQVLVEAKIVEATEGFSRSLGGSLGFGMENVGFASINGSGFNPGTDLVTTADASKSGSGNFGMSLGIVPNTLRVNAVLSLGESENSIKIVSSPKTVVLNKESASILQSTPVVLTSTSVTTSGPATTKTVLDANVSLKVTPTVTNDEGVLMSVDISRDIPQKAGDDTAIAKRNMSTKVIVENGNTLVIGGIYTVDKTREESGIPFLRKIPIIGYLFGTNSSSTSRTELFIFLTPKILNTKKAGLTST